MELKEVESKDFSIELPEMVDKLWFVIVSMQVLDTDGGIDLTQAIDGAAAILRDIYCDLTEINRALYPRKGGNHDREK